MTAEITLDEETKAWIEEFCAMKQLLEKELGHRISLTDFINYLDYCQEKCSEALLSGMKRDRKRIEVG